MKKTIQPSRMDEPRALAPVISRLYRPVDVNADCDCEESEGGTVTMGDDCQYFQVGKTPLKLQIDTLGFTNGACSTCDNYNGQFILEQQSWAPCEWTVATEQTNCFLGGIQWKMYARVFPDALFENLVVAVWYADALQNRIWEYHATVGYNPSVPSTFLNGETLDEVATWVFGSGYCNGVTAAQVRVRGYAE